MRSIVLAISLMVHNGVVHAAECTNLLPNLIGGYGVACAVSNGIKLVRHACMMKSSNPAFTQEQCDTLRLCEEIVRIACADELAKFQADCLTAATLVQQKVPLTRSQSFDNAYTRTQLRVNTLHNTGVPTVLSMMQSATAVTDDFAVHSGDVPVAVYRAQTEQLCSAQKKIAALETALDERDSDSKQPADDQN